MIHPTETGIFLSLVSFIILMSTNLLMYFLFEHNLRIFKYMTIFILIISLAVILTQ